jgi:hypothetical protein
MFAICLLSCFSGAEHASQKAPLVVVAIQVAQIVPIYGAYHRQELWAHAGLTRHARAPDARRRLLRRVVQAWPFSLADADNACRKFRRRLASIRTELVETPGRLARPNDPIAPDVLRDPRQLVHGYEPSSRELRKIFGHESRNEVRTPRFFESRLSNLKVHDLAPLPGVGVADCDGSALELYSESTATHLVEE